MTFAELLQHLDAHAGLAVLDGDAGATLNKAHSGDHADPILGDIIRSIGERTGCTGTDCTLERVQVVSAIGPMRLKYMADDAPVEGLRTVEQFIRGVDAAFDDEALRARHGG